MELQQNTNITVPILDTLLFHYSIRNDLVNKTRQANSNKQTVGLWKAIVEVSKKNL